MKLIISYHFLLEILLKKDHYGNPAIIGRTLNSGKKEIAFLHFNRRDRGPRTFDTADTAVATPLYSLYSNRYPSLQLSLDVGLRKGG